MQAAGHSGQHLLGPPPQLLHPHSDSRGPGTRAGRLDLGWSPTSAWTCPGGAWLGLSFSGTQFPDLESDFALNPAWPWPTPLGLCECGLLSHLLGCLEL